MREGTSLTRAAAFAAMALFLGQGTAPGATAFGASYLSVTSGPASGGATSIVGNQFAPGATVKVGLGSVSAVVTSSTLINASIPALAAGALYDVSVDNGVGPISVLPQAWFADFNDVPPSDPFHASIEGIVRDGITSGCTGGNYCPSTPIPRSQIAVFLLRAKYGKAYFPPTAHGIFADVIPGTTFAADWIEQLYTEGITSGCAVSPLKLFCPDNTVTRAQAAVFVLEIYHGAGYAPPPALGTFADVPAISAYAPWIEELSRLGITAGCGNNNFCPDSPVTRGQMAVFLNTALHRPQATRFLEQASWGPNDPSVSSALVQGPLKWLAGQYSAPPSLYPGFPLWPGDVPASCDDVCRRDNYSSYQLQRGFFVNAVYGPDQLRQRVAWALHKVVVVSEETIPYPYQFAPYIRLLAQGAFGNYRDILYNVTLNPAMGDFLNMDTSTKYDPNENYAREIMQLFSIGTELLNQDGSTQNDANGPKPSYDQSVIDQFKLVYTGWFIDQVPCPSPNGTEQCDNWAIPMSYDDSLHDKRAKTLFGNGFLPTPTLVPAGQTGSQDLNTAIDAIFNHPNVGPYLSRELIHSLVTSNPSPAYVERVAGFFNNDGTGVRGNLWAVVKAILLDPEARTEPSDPNYGHLREPALYIASLLRAFNAMSADRSTQSDGNLETYSREMGQKVWKPPTVFSYFPQFYGAPGAPGVLGPEFGITNTQTSLKRANFVNQMTFWGGDAADPGNDTPNGTSLDFSELKQLAANPSNLVDRLNRLLLHGSMSAELRMAIVNAVTAITASKPLNRAYQALYLVAVASQYQVQR